MISIIYDKSDKKLALSIAQEIKKKGFEYSLNAISDFLSSKNNNLDQVRMAVLIFSEKSNKSEKVMKEFELIFARDLSVIPYVVSDVELSLTMQFFLNSHDWINAYDTNFDTAIKDLQALISEILPQKNRLGTQNSSKSQKTEPLSAKKKQLYVALAVGGIFAIILFFFMYMNNKSSDVVSDNLIVGSWQLANYQDNMARTPEDFATFAESISNLKQVFLLKLKENNEFERYGFSQGGERGTWQFDPQKKLLYLQPPNSQDKDMLLVEKLTKDSLIISIATRVDSITQIITKFSLYKVSN